MLASQRADLRGVTNGPLYILIEHMLEGIRQFVAFEQALPATPEPQPATKRLAGSRPNHPGSEPCFAAMEMLREHMWCWLRQVEAAAQVRIRSVRDDMPYSASWRLEVYQPPRAMEASFGLAMSAD